MQLIPHESNLMRKTRNDVTLLLRSFNELEDEIRHFEFTQYAFEQEYHNRLGDLAEAVSILRAQLGIVESPQSIISAITTLTDNDYKQLKKSYRQAAKLCHPDFLPAHQREEGLTLFDSLHKAYHLQDLVFVEHILWLLHSGQGFSQTPVVISSEDLLVRRKELLELMISQHQDHLAQLKMREDYDVSNRDNWNIILYDYQTQLEDELAVLKPRCSRARRMRNKTT